VDVEQPSRPRLERPLFDVVLVEPEIPNNTGNIGRTCVAAGCRLHLIHPLGFDTSEKACRRAGLDYWPRLDLHEHASWDRYLADAAPKGVWLFSTKATRDLYSADLRRGDAFIFGKETRGLPDSILAAYPERALRLPMMADERSLNLATVVCAAVYEGIRQCLNRRDVIIGPDGRIAL
jgi:tRNA (cytidine/uridine-2'-O-)-methyltransferase